MLWISGAARAQRTAEAVVRPLWHRHRVLFPASELGRVGGTTACALAPKSRIAQGQQFVDHRSLGIA